jgi:mono/diheme cytochrome c family protein
MADICVRSAGQGARVARVIRASRVASAVACALAMLVVFGCARAMAQEAAFPPDQITTGADIFARNCSPCHGSHMREPQGAFDLREFPHDAHERFVSSVTRGKNQMPPWGDLLKAADVEALWAYVVAGER